MSDWMHVAIIRKDGQLSLRINNIETLGLQEPERDYTLAANVKMEEDSVIMDQATMVHHGKMKVKELDICEESL